MSQVSTSASRKPLRTDTKPLFFGSRPADPSRAAAATRTPPAAIAQLYDVQYLSLRTAVYELATQYEQPGFL
jgi:hypothetical protein